MSRRFFCDSPITGGTATLTGQQAHHLSRVMRARVGEVVTLFDGSGVEFTAEISSIGRAAVELHVVNRREVDCELPFQLTVGVALPKGDRQRWLVEKLVELGVTTLVPLVSSRGVAQPGVSAIERLSRAVVEASKQCGRNRLLQVSAAVGVADFFATATEDAIALLADPDARQTADPSCLATRHGDVLLAVGPEGGFTPDEVSLATRHGWRSISLGQRILRTETAAVALAAWLVLSAECPAE